MNRDNSLADNIFEFMQLCNFKGIFNELSAEDPDLIASQNAHEFLANLANNDQTPEIFNNIIGSIRNLTIEQLSTMSPLGRSGSHGQLFKSSMPIYSNFVWKRIMVNSAKPIYAFNTIREAFIQSTLATLDCAPRIGDIRAHRDTSGEYMYILMEKESHELFDQYATEMKINDNLFDRQPLLFFQNSGYLLLQILDKLILLWSTFQFVHRDLKHDNIMLRPVYQNSQIVNYKIHFIDFGFSCITINYQNRAYVIRASRVYGPNTPCDYRQDILSLFANLSEPSIGHRSIYYNMDRYGREAIESVIPTPFQYNSNIMRGRGGQSFFQMMYNRNGTLLNKAKHTRRSNNSSNNTSVWDHLNLDNVYNIIYKKFTESISGLPGTGIEEKAGHAIDNMIKIAKSYKANDTEINALRLTYPKKEAIVAAPSRVFPTNLLFGNQEYADPVSQIGYSAQNAVAKNPLSAIQEEPQILGNELSQVFNNIQSPQQQLLPALGIASNPNINTRINARLPVQATKRRRNELSANNRNTNALPVQAPKLARQTTALSIGGRRTRRAARGSKTLSRRR